MWIKLLDYYNQNTRLFKSTKTYFCRELKILQNCVFIFLKFVIDFKEIANDITNLLLAFFALSQKISDQEQQSWYKLKPIFNMVWSGFESDHVLKKWSQIYFIRSESDLNRVFSHTNWLNWSIIYSAQKTKDIL